MKEKKINPMISVAVLVFSAMTATFNETILNVSLLSIADEFTISVSTVQWLITGYMLVTSVMVPVTAFLYQSIPTKNLFLTAMGIVLAGSVGCFLAPAFPALLIFRMVQAVGTGMMIPIMMNTTLLVVPKEKIGAAMSLCVCGIMLGPAFGPSLSGIIVQFSTWRMCFVLISLLCLIGIILGVFVLDNVAELTHPHLDVLSVILSTIGLAAFLYGVSIITSQLTMGLICILVGLVVIAVFCLRQNKLEEPMLNLSPFKNLEFVLGLIMVFIAMLVNFSLNVVLPSFLQGSLFISSMMSALLLLPGILLNAASTTISGRILDKYGVKIMLPAGFAVFTVCLFGMSKIGVGSAIGVFVLVHILTYQGLAYSMSPAQTTSLACLPRELNAHGVSIVNTFMQIAASVGSSMFGGIQASRQAASLAQGASEAEAIAAGLSTCMLTTMVLGIVGFITSLVFAKKIVK